MKKSTLETEKRSLAELSAENGKEFISLTKKDQIPYALVPLDDMDREVLAIRNNPELMAYIDACCVRARKQPGKTLEHIRKKFGIPRRKQKRPE